MKRVAHRMLHALIMAAPLLLMAQPAAPAATAFAAPDACAGAATATNAVVHYYLALDRRRFAAAYACLTGSARARVPEVAFVRGYTHTVSTILVRADADDTSIAGSDRIDIDLSAVDAGATGLVATTYRGFWLVNRAGRLAKSVIHLVERRPVPMVPATNVGAVIASDGQQVLAHLRADVTADGRADDLYITGGIGCGSCHSQMVWIYSMGRLVFAQQVDNGEIRVARNGAGFELRRTTPGSPGPDCCPTERTYEVWTWTSDGFTLQSRHVVRNR